MSIVLKTSNRPVRDEEGFVKGTLSKVEVETKETRYTNTEGMIDTRSYDVLMFRFVFEGTSTSYKINHMCGLSLSNEKYPSKKQAQKGKKEKTLYNKLTSTCLKLGLLTAEDLKSNADEFDKVRLRVMKDLDAIHDLPVKTKLLKTTKNNLIAISIDNLNVLTDSQEG